MTKEEKKFIRFIDKEMKLQNLDSLLLFLASILGFFFSFVYVVFGYFEVAMAFIPVIILGLVLPIYVGYVRGALILDTLEERIRGWIYFVAGVVVYLIQGMIWLLGKVLPSLPSPYGNLTSGFASVLGYFFLGWLVGAGKLTHWISDSILQIFDEKRTELTGKIFGDTTGSAFFAAIYFFSYFSIYMTGVSYAESFAKLSVILLMIFTTVVAVLSVVWYEKDIRKFVKLNQYSRFLIVERHSIKPRISFAFARIGVLFVLSGLFVYVGIVPMIQTPLAWILSSLTCMVMILVGITLLVLSRKRDTFRISRKKMKIPEEAERELNTLIGK